MNHWYHKEPREYYKRCVEMFGKPTAESNKKGGFAFWKTKGLFHEHILRDEYVKHCVPRPHYDYFYSSIKYHVPKTKVMDVLKISGSLNYDGLKKLLTARCGGIGANYATIYLAMMVSDGKMTIEEIKKNDIYPKMISNELMTRREMVKKMKEMKKKNNKKYKKALKEPFASYAYNKCYTRKMRGGKKKKTRKIVKKKTIKKRGGTRVKSLQKYAIDSMYQMYKKNPKEFYKILKEQNYPDNIIKQINERFNLNLSASSIQKMYEKKIKKEEEKKLAINTEIIPDKSNDSENYAEIWNSNHEKPKWIKVECDECSNFQWFLSNESLWPVYIYNRFGCEYWNDIETHSGKDLVLCDNCIHDSDVIISCKVCSEYYEPHSEQTMDNVIQDPESNDFYCENCFEEKARETIPYNLIGDYVRDSYRASYDDTFTFPWEKYENEDSDSDDSEYEQPIISYQDTRDLRGGKKNKTIKLRKVKIGKGLKNTRNEDCSKRDSTSCCPHMQPDEKGRYRATNEKSILHYKGKKYELHTCCLMCSDAMRALSKQDPEKFASTYIVSFMKNGNMIAKNAHTKKPVQLLKLVQ